MPSKIRHSLLQHLFALLILYAFTCSPAAAQQAGVLLGFAERTEQGSFTYKTAWIVFSSTEAHVAATVPDVIVPRSSGFWSVGTYVACEYDAVTKQDSAREIVWQTPVDSTPIIQQGPACKDHKPGDISDDNTNFDSATFVRICAHESGKIDFVSPTHISEEFDDSDGCDPRGGRDTQRDDVPWSKAPFT